MINNTAPVYCIDRLRINTDGPGIRTLAVFSECPLKCRYCLNPGTWNGEGNPEYYSVKSLYNKVRQDDLYFASSGGGITFGGGEPLLYPEFIRSFIELCPDTWNFAIETSLNTEQENLEKIIDIIDLFIVDVKTLNPELYNKYTTGSLDNVISNLKFLIENTSQDKIKVKVPEIYGFVSKEEQEKTVDILKNSGVENIERIKYIWQI